MSFTKIEIEGKKAAPDRIYYNATVINNTFSTIQQNDDPITVFQDSRQNPIVPDSSNYELSVQNFSLNGAPKTLPLFIPQICPPVITLNFGVSQAIVTAGTPYNTIKYNIPNSFSIGNKILTLSGFTESYLNFSTTQTVIAATPTSFSITNVSGSSVVGTYNSVGAITITCKDPTDVTTTIYTITFACYNGTNKQLVTSSIIWIPENKAPYTIVPKTALPTQIESDYYYCYTYTHWVSLVNTALRTAWTSAMSFGGGTQCPWFEYDETTGLFNINQDSKTSMVPINATISAPYASAVNGVTTNPAGIPYVTTEYSFVGMNTCLESLLSNFPSIYYSDGQVWGGIGANVLPEVVIDMGLSINLLLAAPNTNSPVGISLRTQPKTSIFQLVNPFLNTGITFAIYARLTQDFISTGGIWSPIASFVLGTTQIPVRIESSANPITFGQANVGGNTSTSGAFQKVLIETPINALKADIWKGFILYEPQTLTYTSLDPSHDGIKDVDISLYWRNRLTNSLLPVRLPNQGSVSFRLLFKRKLSL